MQQDPRFPIGVFKPIALDLSIKNQFIDDINHLPTNIDSAIRGLNKEQLNSPYRDGGWTVHELINHIADSHSQAFYRFKYALSEDNPTIKPYNEKEWVKTNDVLLAETALAVSQLKIIHQRWALILNNINDEQWETRSVFHPVQNRKMSLWFLLTLYSWHAQHHTAHITAMRKLKNW